MWDKTKVLQSQQTCPAKGIPANNTLNQDMGYKLPGCWTATKKKLGGGCNCASANHAGVSASALYHMGVQAQEPRL